jgi:IMP dehydrogenase
VGGLRSGLSYAGAATIEELWQKAEFIRITSAGKRESGAHDVDRF